MATARTSHRRPVGARHRAKLKNWSGKVTRASDPPPKRGAREIAASVRRSAKRGLRKLFAH